MQPPGVTLGRARSLPAPLALPVVLASFTQVALPLPNAEPPLPEQPGSNSTVRCVLCQERPRGEGTASQLTPARGGDPRCRVLCRGPSEDRRSRVRRKRGTHG